MKDKMMRHADFYIGLEFFTSSGRWRCTDVGTRTICAISLDPHEVIEGTQGEQGNYSERRYVTDDPSWLIGPPYKVTEQVFDEYDIDDCALTSR
jgi:hypothetical protein